MACYNMNNKIISGLCIIIFLVSTASALTIYEEQSLVSKIVGESPTEMLIQLRDDEDVFDSTYNHLDIWPDYAGVGVKVNKQRGDKLKLNIYTDYAVNVNVWYDNSVFDGDCPIGSKSLSSGVNTCGLEVKDDASYGETQLKVNNDKVASINVISSANLLVVTDSEKLKQRFPHEENGVKAVLKQAYANAERSNGVVYDLSWYKNQLGVNNPFISYSAYNERITMPNMLDNSYSLAFSNFIKEKCDINNDGIGCKDVMIVGDDFVVPYYRNEVPITEGFSALGIVDWFEDRISKPIYTDSGFIQRKFDFKISDLKEMENRVYFVLPNNMNSELKDSIDKFELTIKSKFDVKVNEIQGNEVSCDDVQYFDSFNDASLFIIGDRENNPSLKCYPFIELEENMITVQPNIWDSAHLFDDSKSFTVIINSLNPNVTMNVDYLFKNDIYLDINRRSAIIDYAVMGTVAVGAGAVIIGAVTVGSPVLVIGGVALAGTSIANECVIKNAGGDNWAWCGFDAVFTVVGGKLIVLGFKASKPIVKWTVRNTIGRLGDTLIAKYGDEFFSSMYDLIKQGKYKSFVKALNNGKRYADDIFNFFRKQISRFDNLIGKASDNIDFYDNKLSQAAKKVAAETQQGFGSRLSPTALSEAASFQNMEKRGMKLIHTEQELMQHNSGRLVVDYIGDLGGRKTGVSVTRAVINPTTSLKSTIESKVTDIIDRKKVYPKNLQWQDNVVHIVAETEDLVKESEEIVRELIEDNVVGGIQDIKFVITKIQDQQFIYR